MCQPSCFFSYLFGEFSSRRNDDGADIGSRCPLESCSGPRQARVFMYDALENREKEGYSFARPGLSLSNTAQRLEQSNQLKRNEPPTRLCLQEMLELFLTAPRSWSSGPCHE